MSDRQPSAGAAGWAMFAGFVMIMVGCFHMIWGFGAILNDALYNAPSDYFLKVNQSGWGWIHVIAGLIVLLAGFGIFKGAVWARTVGVIIATRRAGRCVAAHGRGARCRVPAAARSGPVHAAPARVRTA
jgi:hypothetical protein